MDEKQLAIEFYLAGEDYAKSHEAPQSAVAAAMIRAGLQMYSSTMGADELAMWLQREASAMRDAIN